MADNKSLQKVYDAGELNWHSGYEESMGIARMVKHWAGKTVLEIGCGPGHLASILSYAGANVTAIDYSAGQIERAKNNYGTDRVNFKERDYRTIKKTRYQIIVLQGVLEHFDKPEVELKWIVDNLLKIEAGSQVILSVPHWWNPRGFILQALRLILDAKISLTDLHYFLPGDLKMMSQIVKMDLVDYAVVDESWGAGREAIADLVERIPKALPDVDPEKVQRLSDWLKRALLDKTVAFEGLGATAIYKLVR